MKTIQEVMEKYHLTRKEYAQREGGSYYTVENIEMAMADYADQFKVKNLVKPDVMRSFTIRKIRLGKCSFEKRRFGVSVIDLTEIGTDLHMIAIQLFFKTGLAIFYKLIEDEK